MGTNYYKVVPLTRQEKEAIKESIENNDFTVNSNGEVSFFYNDYRKIDLHKTEIHIGKSSAGWKFLFDYNEWRYFNNTERSLLEWLKNTSDGSYIKNEYDEKLTYEELLSIINNTYDTPWLDGKERKSHLKSNNKHYYTKLGKYEIALFTDFC